MAIGTSCGAQPDAQRTPTSTVLVSAEPPAIQQSAPPPPTAPAASSATPQKLPIRSATPGHIQCETVDCDLQTQVCCVGADRVGRCVPRSNATSNPCGAETEERQCDERSDCGSGSRCCWDLVFDDECNGIERWSCKTGCSSAADLSGELCLPGSSCTNGTCIASGDRTGSPLSGLCPLDTPALACGKAKCSPGEACCWDPAKRVGTCTKTGACEGGHDSNSVRRLFACQKLSDCGDGYECFNNTGMHTREEFACSQTQCNMMALYLGPFLCQSVKDCPQTRVTMDQNDNVIEFHVTGCRARGDDPAGVKTCTY